jgi:glycerate kinase
MRTDVLPGIEPLTAATESLTVMIAASRVSRSLGPRQVAAAIGEGIRAAMPEVRVLRVPTIEAGAGFMDEIVQLSDGTIEPVAVDGPYGQAAIGRIGLIGPAGERKAIIDLDEIYELQQLPPDCCDTTRASSRAAGQLIVAALDRGVRQIVISCGANGANDGGIGMATALGIRFLDARRSEIVEAGGLQRLDSIDTSRRDRRLDDTCIEAVVDPGRFLLGPSGVARNCGLAESPPSARTMRLESGLARYAEVVQRVLGVDATLLDGGGASGGLGAGLVVFAGGRLTSRAAFLRHCPGLVSTMATAHLVITADDPDFALAPYDQSNLSNEGSPALPRSRPARAGQATSEALAWVVRQARALGLPVVSLGCRQDADTDLAFTSEWPTTALVGPRQGKVDDALARRVVEWLRQSGASAIHAVSARRIAKMKPA